MKIKLLFPILISVISIVGCGKEGPEGPLGPEGPQGPQGAPGSANVKRFSYNIPLNSFSKWTSTNEFWVYQTIGTDIGPNDAVLVYVWEDHAGVDEWMALPMLSYWNTGSCFNAFNYSIASSDRLQFSIRNSCGVDPYSNMNTGSLSYRVFVLSGDAGRQIINSIDITDYNAVAEALGYLD